MRSSESRPFLVTGAAGFLGSHLTFGLLERGVPVVALARADGERSALERLEAAAGLLDWRGEWPPRELTVVETDLDEPWLGLGPVEATTLLRRCREVIHAAARVDFSESQREEIFRTNAWSLAAWLPLLRRTRTPFNLVSTAYAAGRGVAVAREEPVHDPRCRNPYEASKVAAERWVFEDLAPMGVPWRIFRPSIVVGEAATGRATRFSTVYVLWELLDGLRRSVLDPEDGDDPSPVPLRIACDPRASLALVPVDYVVDAVRAILLRPGTVGGIYHLTPEAPPTLDRLGRWMASAFAPLVPEAASPESFRTHPADGRERLLARGLGVYEPYLHCRTRFDTYHVRRALHGTGVRVPTVDETVWDRCVAYARQVEWGRSLHRSRSNADGGSRAVREEAEIFFDVHLAAWLGDRLLPEASSSTSTFEVALTDLPGFVRSVEVRDGRLVRVAGARSDAACRYELDSRTFRRIASGRLDPREAFFTRQTEIRGDVEAGLAVATWMIEFFRRYPLARHGAPSSWVS